jgi:hypothetical protein
MRLSPAKKTKWRIEQLEISDKCRLCGQQCQNPVVDHNHRTGALRGVICRSCNSALGAIERTFRYGIKDIVKFAEDAAVYLRYHSEDRTGLLHDTHRTEDEKKLRRKKRAARNKTK